MNRTGDSAASTRYGILLESSEKLAAARNETALPRIQVGMATCGRAAGAEETMEAFRTAVREEGIKAVIEPVGCIGHCYAEPLVIIRNPGFPSICYYNISPSKARVLVRAFLVRGDPMFEYVMGALEDNDTIPAVSNFPRFGMEKRIVMERCGLINPEDIDEYISGGGYASLAKALTMKPADIIDEVIESGIRGRGGGGFPAGIKWEMAFTISGKKKVLICNADEGDPGAYMDRTIIESNPHQLLEGIIIGSYAIGADRAVIYIRSEYPLSIRMIRTAMEQARERGLIGDGVLGTGFNLELSVFKGSGAFVCGEETALI